MGYDCHEVHARLPVARVSARVAAHFVMAALAIAGVLKLTDLPAFVESLRGWTLIPRELHAPVAVTLPILETSLAGLWLLGRGRCIALSGTLALLGLLCLANALQSLLGEPPSCHCFGARIEFENTRLAAAWGVGKGLVLLLLLIPEALAMSRPSEGVCP